MTKKVVVETKYSTPPAEQSYPLGIFNSREEVELAYAPVRHHRYINHSHSAVEMDTTMSTKNNSAKKSVVASTKTNSKLGMLCSVCNLPEAHEEHQGKKADHKFKAGKTAAKASDMKRLPDYGVEVPAKMLKLPAHIAKVVKTATKKSAPKVERIAPIAAAEKLVVLKSIKGVDELPTQAQTIVNTLKAKGGKVAFEALLKLLDKALDTCQSSKRIYTFYQRRLIDEGFITVKASA